MIATLSQPMRLGEIAYAIGACPANTDRRIRRVVIDSREATEGDIFFAIDGEHRAAAPFVSDALARGAAAVSYERQPGALLVSDTRRALHALAAYYRTNISRPRTTVAITGSVGKTTTRRLLFTLIGGHRVVHTTEGNYNNGIGLPMTMLRAPIEADVQLLELGISHPGDMEPLVHLARPDIGILTGVGQAHIGNFADEALLFKEKCRLLDTVGESCCLVPWDDARFREHRRGIGVSQTDIRAPYAMIAAPSSGTFTFYEHGRPTLRHPLLLTGRGAQLDLSLALSAARLMGVSCEELNTRLPLITEELLRLRRRPARFGGLLLDDAYNASPESVRDALSTLTQGTDRGRCVLLGDMLELGGETERAHRAIGQVLSEHGIERAFFFGVYAPFYRLGALDGGLAAESIFINNDPTDPERTVKQILDVCGSGDTLLCKGSHATAVGRIIEQLTL